MSTLSKFRTVHEATIPSYRFRSILVGNSILHDIQTTGPISLAERMPLYEQTIDISGPGNYFCILDNLAGHENNFTFDDIKVLDEYLVSRGVTQFYGVTLTRDDGYARLAALASTNMHVRGIAGDLHVSEFRQDAESYIVDKMRNAARSAGQEPMTGTS